MDAVLAATQVALQASVPSHLCHIMLDAGGPGNAMDARAAFTPEDRSSLFVRLFELREELRARLAFHFSVCVPTADETLIASQRMTRASSAF